MAAQRLWEQRVENRDKDLFIILGRFLSLSNFKGIRKVCL